MKEILIAIQDQLNQLAEGNLTEEQCLGTIQDIIWESGI